MLAEGATLSGVPIFRNEDCRRMKDWRSSLNADAEGASSFFGMNLSGKRTVFLVAFVLPRLL